jgi:SPP1 gp7 family putative phage head morphogenesis protein
MASGFEPPLTEADLPDTMGARSDMLTEWDRRMAVLWLEWQSHPQRLRPLRELMEQGLLRAYAALTNELRQRALGITRYVWRSRDDARVRSAHAAYDDQIFAWDAPPEGGHPGQAHNCRCWAEPVVDDASTSFDGFALRNGETDRGIAQRSAAQKRRCRLSNRRSKLWPA